MKVAFVHPLRHHAYSSIVGISECSELTAYLGYFNRGDIIDKLMYKLGMGRFIEGYKFQEINHVVEVSMIIKVFFILWKIKPTWFEKLFFSSFQIWVNRKLNDFDVIHFVQDYCNVSIRKAKSLGKQIVYEQIMPFDSLQKSIFETEMKKFDYIDSFTTSRFSSVKIGLQLENINMSDYFIANSVVTANSLKQYVSEDRLYTIPLGTVIKQLPEYQLKAKLRKVKHTKTLKFLYIGAHNLIKGTRYIVAAAERLKDYDVEFTFVGKPQFDKDNQIIEKINSLKNAKHITSIPHSEIRDIYEKNNVFIFQGLCEGFGIVTLEAMSCGLPCLVSEGGMGVIRDGIDGYINKNRDVDALVDKILYLNDNRAEVIRLAENAVARASSYTWKEYADKTKDAYKLMFQTD